MAAWKKIGSKVVYRNPYFYVEEHKVFRPDGKKGIYGVVHKPSGCRIIAIDKDERIVFIRIERYPIGKVLLEVPAGANDPKLTEVESTKKEFYEETGLHARKWKKIGRIYWAAGVINAYDNVFVAHELVGEGSIKNQEGNEGIKRIEKFSVQEIKKLIKDGKIECGITLAALMLFFSKSSCYRGMVI